VLFRYEFTHTPTLLDVVLSNQSCANVRILFSGIPTPKKGGYLNDDERVLGAVQGRAKHVGHARIQLEEGVALGTGGHLNTVKKGRKGRKGS
jgi:hypothetical protein